MAIPSCPGVIVDNAGVLACEDGSSNPVAWESVPTFTIDDIDFDTAGSAFAAGFVIVGMAWAIGWVCRALLRTISGKGS